MSIAYEDVIAQWTPGISPLMKGGRVEKGLIRGVATSERRDIQGEILRRDGADPGPFLGALAKGANADPMVDGFSGSITLEHPAGVFNPVAEPVDIEKGTTAKGDKCFFLVSRLWVDDEPLAAQTWDKVLRIQKASSRVRLGYSVEGHATKRNPMDKKDIEQWVWANTVITGSPRNRDAMFSPIFASLNATALGRDLLRKAIESGALPTPRDFAPELGEGGVLVDGVDVAEVTRLGQLAAKLNLTPVDMAVATALKGSSAWTSVLAKIMQRVAQTLGS